ncbi:MAG: phosphodiester glycosidase family protein [Acidobacteriota bacterium]
MQLKRPLKILAQFMVFNIILFVLTFLPITLYGPFKNIRNTVIGSVGTSMHAYLLGYVLGQDELDRIMAQSQASGSVDEKLFTFDKRHSNDITLSEINGSRYKGYLLKISDPSRVQLAPASSMGIKGQTTSQIARENNAIASVNAGGFIDPHGTGTGRLPYGVVIHDGEFLAGEDCQGKVQLAGLTDDGLLVAGKYTVEEIKEMHIKEGISFGPPLILNGDKQISEGDGGWGIAPRTALGQTEDGTILLLVIDGRQLQHSLGATIVDVQDILYENGAVTAVNLDGGSSTTMYYSGKVINRPCDILGERQIPTAFIVK